LFLGGLWEAQAQVSAGEKGGDYADGLGEGVVAIVHERSPLGPPTTISA
jgi:hypothetical protein